LDLDFFWQLSTYRRLPPVAAAERQSENKKQMGAHVAVRGGG
jgi:hypothetical protein